MECYAIDYALKAISSRRLLIYCDAYGLVEVLCNGKKARRRSRKLVRSIRENCARREVSFAWIDGRRNPADHILKGRTGNVIFVSPREETLNADATIN